MPSLTDRGRTRMRKGDIFTSIRKRFTKRSKSAVPGEETEDPDKEDNRSASADRGTVPFGRHLGFGGGSTRSSASELSAISGQSTATYYHENSTLVVECMENKIQRYGEKLKQNIISNFDDIKPSL